MRRLVALVLACGLVASSTVAASLHVHDYVDHDHPEHHHGPAAHDHGDRPDVDDDHHPIADDDPAIDDESCDPGRHVISARVGCVSASHGPVDVGESPGPAVAVPTRVVRSTLRITDVRVHGPPFGARAPSRAPPLNPHS